MNCGGQVTAEPDTVADTKEAAEIKAFGLEKC